MYLDRYINKAVEPPFRYSSAERYPTGVGGYLPHLPPFKSLAVRVGVVFMLRGSAAKRHTLVLLVRLNFSLILEKQRLLNKREKDDEYKLYYLTVKGIGRVKKSTNKMSVSVTSVAQINTRMTRLKL